MARWRSALAWDDRSLQHSLGNFESSNPMPDLRMLKCKPLKVLNRARRVEADGPLREQHIGCYGVEMARDQSQG